jgi:8-oxo-dGTP pyrophosphatase MutT (NUDIX family)
MAEPFYARRSARVLLLDGVDRLLLMKHGSEWYTPGGGLDDGEDPREAAVREMREEIGLDVGTGDLGPLVAVTSGHASLGWVEGLMRDEFFLHRVAFHEVDTRGLDAYEVATYAGHHWWSVDELAATGETVHPLGLAPLVADLVAGRIPPEPVRLPWHH